MTYFENVKNLTTYSINWISNDAGDSLGGETKSKSHVNWCLFGVVVGKGFHSIVRAEETGTENDNSDQGDGETLVQTGDTENCIKTSQMTFAQNVLKSCEL